MSLILYNISILCCEGKCFMTIENSNPFKNEDVVVNEENTNTDEIKEETKAEETPVEENKNDKLQEEYDKLNQQYIRLAADFSFSCSVYQIIKGIQTTIGRAKDANTFAYSLIFPIAF